MTTTELDLQFPPIAPPPADAPVAMPAPKTLTVAEFVRAQFASHEPTLTMLAAKHKADKVVIGTGKGTTEGAKSLTAAKAIRAELREHGRFAVQRALETLKKDLNGAKKIADEEAARLIAIVEPVEKVYDDAIKAEEARIERERQAELDRQRVRREGFQQAIRAILEYQRAAAGLSAERIARGLEKLELMEFDPEHWAEFTNEAKLAHAETVDALRKMHAEAVRLEALEAENARLRAEALERAQVALATAPAASPEAEKVAEAAAEVVVNAARSAQPATNAELIEKARGIVNDIIAAETLRDAMPPHDPDTGEVLGDDESLAEGPAGVAAAMRDAIVARAAQQVREVNEAAERATVQVLAPVAHDLPVIKLGAICEAMGKGFSMTREFAETVLGVPGTPGKGTAYEYTAAGRRALLEALIDRINAIK